MIDWDLYPMMHANFVIKILLDKSLLCDDIFGIFVSIIEISFLLSIETKTQTLQPTKCY